MEYKEFCPNKCNEKIGRELRDIVFDIKPYLLKNEKEKLGNKQLIIQFCDYCGWINPILDTFPNEIIELYNDIIKDDVEKLIKPLIKKDII